MVEQNIQTTDLFRLIISCLTEFTNHVIKYCEKSLKEEWWGKWAIKLLVEILKKSN